jgi:hypothetical protein
VSLELLITSLLLACSIGSSESDAGVPPARLSTPIGHAQFDASRLRVGEFRYRTLVKGNEAGTSSISITRTAPDTYRFRNQVSGQFRQTWEAIASGRFEPRSATLGLAQDDDRRRSMSLVYDAGVVSGTATRTDPVKGAQTSEVSARVPEDVVDQRIDWAAVMSTSLSPGRTIAFSVYDPWIGVSRVSGQVGEPEIITVPAGTFETRRVVYVIEKSSGTERYEVWVSKESPRFMVREDFPSGASTQLVAR